MDANPTTATIELPSNKPDEHWFWNRLRNEVGSYGGLPEEVRVSPRDIINEEGFPIPHKRAWAMLEKWSDRGWYSYGVTLDLGWITPEGWKVVAKDVTEAQS